MLHACAAGGAAGRRCELPAVVWCGSGILTILTSRIILTPTIRGRNWPVGVHERRTGRARRTWRARRRRRINVWHAGWRGAGVGGWLWYIIDSDFLAILMAILWS